MNGETIIIHACLITPPLGSTTDFYYTIITCVQYGRSSTLYHHQRDVTKLILPRISSLHPAPTIDTATFHQQNSNLAHMDHFKFKSSKKGSPGDRASTQSESPDSSRKGFRERLRWGSRSRSRSRPPSDTPDGSPASQSQADSASVHAQPDGPYSDTPILQIYEPNPVTF